MTTVHHVTDGTTNWSFRVSQTSVKMTVTQGYGIKSTKEMTLEEGREAYKLLSKFNGEARKGFTKLGKMLRLRTVEQVRKYDESCREHFGEDNWPEHSLSTWGEFHEVGYITCYPAR